MIYLVAIVLCIVSIDTINSELRFLTNLKKDQKEKLDTSKVYEVSPDDKLHIIVTILILFVILALVTFILKTSIADNDEGFNDIEALFLSMVFLMFATIVQWYVLIKKEIANENIKNQQNKMDRLTLKDRISKYSGMTITTICCTILSFLLITAMFEEQLIKMSYQLKASEIKEIYQEQYVPTIEKDIRTEKLPDITITVNKCNFTDISYDDVPIYNLNFNYSSEMIDDYYDSAIHSSDEAKELFDTILEVNFKKNNYEAAIEALWDGEPYKSNKTVVEFKEDDRFEMIIKSKGHIYKIKNNRWIDALYIDNKLMYKLDKNRSDSYHKPNYDLKPEKPSYDYSKPNYSSGGGKYDSYDDGYNSVIEDGDYDLDRYYEDDDYQMGVDDALDEMEEDY